MATTCACKRHDFEVLVRWEREWCALLCCRACGRYFVDMAHMHFTWPAEEISRAPVDRLVRADPDVRHDAISALEPQGGGRLRVAEFEEFLSNAVP